MACPVCSGVMKAAFATREMMEGSRHPFHYGRCTVCHALVLIDPPADFSPYYGGGYYSFRGDYDAEFSSLEVREQRGKAVRDLLRLPAGKARRLPWIDSWRPLWSMRRLDLNESARILDVGCGAGRLLYLLNLAGFRRLKGVDQYIDAPRRYDNGVEIAAGTLGQVTGEFDLIMMHHLFEHVGDPIELLSQARARLAPHGTILLRTPMADSLAARHYGSDWVQLDAPRHVVVHTRRSLRHAAAAAGLEVAAVVCDSFEFQFWGSEQYRLNIPLNDEFSWNGPGAAKPFSKARVARWRRLSRILNWLGKGDQAAIYLRAV